MKGIIQLAFLWVFSSSVEYLQDCFMLQGIPAVPFLCFSNSTIYLSVPLLVGVGAASSFGLLWIKFLWVSWTSLSLDICFHFFWINTKQELLGKRVGVCLTLQKSAKSFPKVVITSNVFAKQCMKALVFPHSSQYLMWPAYSF